MAEQQRVWELSTEQPGKPVQPGQYRLGPDLSDSKTRTFKRSYPGDSVDSERRQRARLLPTTSGNYWDRYESSLAVQRLGPAPNGIAAFSRIDDHHTKLWMTTYPYAQINKTRIFGPQESLIFHVHVAKNRRTRDLNRRANLWRRVVERTQFAAAPIADDEVDDSNPLADTFKNNGPIMRPDNDVLYLDKTFWHQYFARTDYDVDIFIPGVFPDDLARIENVAVDIAVLRNKAEFETVARAIGRSLPNVKIFWAVVTAIAKRPQQVPNDQIAHLDDGLPWVTDAEKVKLGIHRDVGYEPTRGDVTNNLKRLKLLGELEQALQVKYVKLTYFEDDKQVLHGENATFDLDSELPVVNIFCSP